MTSKKRVPARRASDAAMHKRTRAAHLADLLHRLDSQRDRERMQLSRELHDTLVSTLSAVKLECDWLQRAKPASEAEQRARLSRVSGSLGEAIQFTRQVIDRLWPSAVQHLGLAAALQGLLAGTRARWGGEAQLDVHGDVDSLPQEQTVVLYRAAVEALELVTGPDAKPRVHLQLRRSESGVELAFVVSGVNIQSDSNGSALADALMQERVLHLHGEYTLANDGDGMVRLRLFLPTPGPAPLSRAGWSTS